MKNVKIIDNPDLLEDIDKLYKAFDDERISLPIRWDGKDFSITVREYQEMYYNILTGLGNLVEISEISEIQSLIIEAIDSYLNGSPSLAYNKIEMLLSKYMDKFTILTELDDEFYRVVKVNDKCAYQRRNVFHTPYSLRNKISTSRFSIPGYPCLYLSSSLKLCVKEVDYNPYQNYYICSKYKFDFKKYNIKLLDLSVKFDNIYNKNIDLKKLDANYRNYLYAFPLVMACSFTRTNRNDHFAPEYIVPQLLLECLKNMNERGNYNSLIGIKYFSCYSKYLSDLGYNIVFPTYKKNKNNDYCLILSDIFYTTKPLLLNDYESIDECQLFLDYDIDYKSVMDEEKG